jgi:putative ABC transport system permease protein
MTSLWQDLRFAWRGLTKQPLSSLMTAGILAIGIAGAVTVFSLFNGLFLRPFPIPDQDRVVHLRETDPRSGMADGDVPYAHFHAWRQHNTTFESMSFSSFWAANLTVDDKVQRVGIRLTTHDRLGVLGLRPLLGRGFTEEEDRPGGPNVVLISHRLWTHLFNKDPAVLGHTLSLDHDLYTVIGVLPPEADFPEPKEIWQPLRADPEKGHGGMGREASGRLRMGMSVEQATADLTRIHQGWLQQHPEHELTSRPLVTPIREVYRQQLKQFRVGTSVLLVVVAFVLVIACCNVTSILLARATHQSKEIALRAALGATRGRIIRQVLATSLLLSAAGGLLGVVLGNHVLELLLSQLSNVIPGWMRFEPDLRFLLFCILLVGLATLLSGLLPALHAASPKNLHTVLQSMASRSGGSRRQRQTLNVIVTAEVGLALALLMGAGLLLRTFCQVQGVDPGLRAGGVLTYNISLPIGPYFNEAKRRAFWDQHLERVRALAGVSGAAMANYLPTTWPSFGSFEVEDSEQRSAGQSQSSIHTQRVTPGCLETLAVRMVTGRPFTEEDARPGGEKVAVVNEAFVKQLWPGRNPIDRRIRLAGSQDWVRVIGEAGDVVNSGLDDSPWPSVYLLTCDDVPFGMFGIVRTSGDPLSLMTSIRAIVHSADPELPIEDVQTLSGRIARSLWLRRIIAWVFGVPAVTAAIMACAGIYGVISYSVGRRVQEIGVRMALGATSPEVMKMVLSQGLGLVLAGLALGVPGGFILSRLFAGIPGMLYHVNPLDPVTFAGVLLLLTSVAVVACVIPARRAARIDPMEALRCE